jgi:ribose transport system ATP-binding protein
MQEISKAFFGIPALRNVTLECGKAEVRAILGENGAGKSTLMKILAGVHQPDSGRIVLDGDEVHFAHPRQAQARGVSIIHQEFNLLPERTVAENMFVGREPRKGLTVNRRKMDEDTVALLAQLGGDRTISPRMPVGRLSVAQQQTVEIAKALSYEPRILIMDEPTASLSLHEVDALFAAVRALQERGLTVLYVSHRLKELFEIASRVTVLKDGALVDTVSTSDVTSGDLVRLMVGRELTHYFPPHATPAEVGAVRLAVRDGAVGLLHDINLEVRAGEVVGIAGLEGSGRTELARAIFGATPFRKGTLEIDGKTRRIRSPRQAIRAGLGFLTEDRKAEGLVLLLPVRDNTLLPVRTLRRKVVTAVGELVKRVGLRGARLDTEARFLSGGNQQKVVLAKWLATEAGIFIFDEPTRGIDVGAKAGIHELVRELARQGAAILMISSELPEVIGMSDRVLVMRDGTIAGALGADPSEADIMLLATGETSATEAA